MKDVELSPKIIKRPRLVLDKATIDEFGHPFIHRGRVVEDVYYCPCCGKRMEGDYMHYCDNCGQKIKEEKRLNETVL